MIQEKTLILNGKRVHYLEGGRGEVILLIHGWLGSSDGFCKVAPILARKFHVIAPDLPGCGLKNKSSTYFSDELSSRHTINNYIEFLRAFIKTKKLGKVNLIGLSMGGTIVLRFGIKYPHDIKKIIVFEPYLSHGAVKILINALCKISSLKSLQKIFRWVVWQVISKNDAFNFLEENDKKAMFSEVYGGSLKAASESIIDLTERFEIKNYQAIKAKTLIVGGDKKNIISSPDERFSLSKTISGSRVINCSISHNFVREDPEGFSKLVADFLRE